MLLITEFEPNHEVNVKTAQQQRVLFFYTYTVAYNPTSSHRVRVITQNYLFFHTTSTFEHLISAKH